MYLRVILVVVLMMLTGCAGLPKGVDRPESRVLENTEDTCLAKEYQPQVKAHSGQSGFMLLPDGLDAFAARATLARMAQKSIDAQYYLFHNDLTGRLLLNELIEAANKGVRVRLLVDDMGLWERTMGAGVVSSHPRIEVRIFNPFSRGGSRIAQMIYRFGSVTRRMHNKAFITDNQVAILGGRNIGNEYFQADSEIEFADLDVLAVGPVVREVSLSFDKYWNSELSYPAPVLLKKMPGKDTLETYRREMETFIQDQNGSAYLKALASSDIASLLKLGEAEFSWGKAVAVYDEPEKIMASRDRTDIHLSSRLAPHFNRVDQELIIFSPYFVPGKEGVKYLAAMCRKGIRVRVLTNSLASTDVSLVHAGYSRYRKALLRGGIELYELDKKISRKEKKEKKGKFGASKASLHTKSFVLDRKQVFVGSLNLDPRSVVENTEIGLILDSPEIGKHLGHWFDTHVDKIAFELELRQNQDGPDQIRWHRQVDGENKVYIRDPHTSFFKRLGINLLKILPLESQL